jgi:voltage-gated potassium channel
MDKFNRKFIVAITMISFYLIMGTVFFHLAEGWRFVDAFYFTGTTLTTVGYGDLHPTHDLTKVVAVLFAFSGIGIVFYSISIIGQMYFEREEERLQKIWESTRERGQEIKARRDEHLNTVKSKLRSIRRSHLLGRMEDDDQRMRAEQRTQQDAGARK